ncbi:hypothetical protein YPPY113_1014, partial [Yersinia pestis PY-113]
MVTEQSGTEWGIIK